MKMVFDTNVLIDGFQDDFSAQAQLITAVRDGELQALVTGRVMGEYKKILKKLISDEEYKDIIEDFFSMTYDVVPQHVNVVIDDEDDRKFIETALGGGADYIVTNDRHLLDIGEVESVRIVTPQEAFQIYKEGSGGSSEWSEFVRSLGIGK